MGQPAIWCAAVGLIFLTGCQRMAARTSALPGAPAGVQAAASSRGLGAPPVREAREDVPASNGGSAAPTAGNPPASSPGVPAAKPAAGPPAPKPHVGKEIVVSWDASLMYLLKDGKPTGKPLVLNGARRQYLRPQHIGSFRLSEKMRLKRSNLYDVNGDPLPDKRMASTNGAYMRNWMRLGGLPVGLHHSSAFRYYRSPSARHRSHGCYRMSRRDSSMVFKWAPTGTPIHVVRSLGGTEWEFLLNRTPAELIPPVKATAVAERSTRRQSRRARVASTTAARPVRGRATATAPRASAPKPRPAAQPGVAEKPHTPSPDALQSGTPSSQAGSPQAEPAPQPNPAPPAGDAD